MVLISARLTVERILRETTMVPAEQLLASQSPALVNYSNPQEGGAGKGYPA